MIVLLTYILACSSVHLSSSPNKLHLSHSVTCQYFPSNTFIILFSFAFEFHHVSFLLLYYNLSLPAVVWPPYIFPFIKNINGINLKHLIPAHSLYINHFSEYQFHLLSLPVFLMTFLNLFPSFLISRSCFIFLTYPCLKMLDLLSVPFILVILDLFLKTFFLL